MASAQLERPSLLRMLSRSGQNSLASQDRTQSGEEAGGEVFLRDLPTPAFVINRHAFVQNCRRVLELADSRQFKLRPHIKTHKTLEGLHLQATGAIAGAGVAAGIAGFVASTIPEVKLLVNYYTKQTAGHSSSTIVYGIPISQTKLPSLWALQENLVQWHIQWNAVNQNPPQIVLLMDHIQQIDMVQQFFQTLPVQQGLEEFAFFPVMLKLDSGYHRAGVPCADNFQTAVQLVDAILKSPVLQFKGVYTHCGHAYDVQDQQELDEIAQNDMSCIRALLQLFEEHWKDSPQQVFGIPTGFTISVGSTPSLTHHWNPRDPTHNSQANTWWNEFFRRHPLAILEIHAGNYTLFDRQQLHTQACPHVDAIAGRVMTRVIGHYNDEHRPNTILMDAGATALTKESTPQGGFAEIANITTPAVVYKCAQEVTMARGTDATLLQECPLGSLVSLLPNHSCLAAACFERYYIIDDPTCQFKPDTPIVEEWEPVKGW